MPTRSAARRASTISPARCWSSPPWTCRVRSISRRRRPCRGSNSPVRSARATRKAARRRPAAPATSRSIRRVPPGSSRRACAASANRPFGLSLATLVPPFSPVRRNGPHGPIFFRERAHGDDIREGKAAAGRDRLAHRARSSRRGSPGRRARESRPIRRLRRPSRGGRPCPLCARDRRPPRLPARVHGRRVVAWNRTPAPEAVALRARARASRRGAYARAGCGPVEVQGRAAGRRRRRLEARRRRPDIRDSVRRDRAGQLDRREVDMSQEIIDAVRELERDKGIEEGTLVAAIEDALLAAYKKTPGAARHAVVEMDDQGDSHVFSIELPGDLEVRLLDEARERKLEELERLEEETGERQHTVITEVRSGTKGPQVILSRRDPELIKTLFELEVPEIADGLVTIEGVAREPGYRSKIAVQSHTQGVDPVGACVGPRGSRVRMVVSELRGEKIDIIPWNPEPARFVAKALSPARVREVYLDDEGKEATVVVPDDQLALAIGKEGMNARLAARLTGWKIGIQSDTEFAQAEAEAAFGGGEPGAEDFSGRCAAILANGKRCPNATLPGSKYCGVPAHQALALQDSDDEEPVVTESEPALEALSDITEPDAESVGPSLPELEVTEVESEAPADVASTHGPDAV